MGAFGAAKAKVDASTIALFVVADEPETPNSAEPTEVNEFDPGPKRVIRSEKSLDAEILDIERVSRAAGYRVSEGEGASAFHATQGSSPIIPVKAFERPDVTPGPREPTQKSQRVRPPVLRRRLINVPQEALSLRARSAVLDDFATWSNDLGLTKKLGFIEMVKRITQRSRDQDPVDERQDADLIEASEEFQGQLPRHLARLQSDPEEPSNWYLPTSTIIAFEEWAAERGLTKKKGFEEMVKRVTRSR